MYNIKEKKTFINQIEYLKKKKKFHFLAYTDIINPLDLLNVL